MLRRAVELDDKAAAWHLALGHALRDAGELPQAAECLQRAIGLDAENILAQQTLRDTLTDLEQFEGATVAARAVVSLRGNADDCRTLAQLLERQGQQEEADLIHEQGRQRAGER